MSALYIGIMTGNSMDAIDVVLADWNNGTLSLKAQKSTPFSHDMITLVQRVRHKVMSGISMADLNALPCFRNLHDTYVHQIAQAVIELIRTHHINPSDIKAICSHGKTLDHCPPSRARQLGCLPYTLQIGSGQMLADLISKKLNASIRVLYDFRSDDIMNGGEGAPLAPPLSALLARQEGVLNKIDYNAGNTSNPTIIINGQALQSWDAGPCNEFIDAIVRYHTRDTYDRDGQYSLKGFLDETLLQQLYDLGRSYYEQPPPKSGDPAYYHCARITAFQKKENFNQALYTAAYFAGYIAALTLRFVSPNINMPTEISLYGGGWNHPIVRQTFENLLMGNGFILPEHKPVFQSIQRRFTRKPHVYFSPLQKTMEALLWAAMGVAYDEQRPWTQPALTGCQQPSICGMEAFSDPTRTLYLDCMSRASKGWQIKGKVSTEFSAIS